MLFLTRLNKYFFVSFAKKFIRVLIIQTFVLAPVVQKMDNAIHLINLYPVNKTIGFDTCSLDSEYAFNSVFRFLWEQLHSKIIRYLDFMSV